MQIPVVTTLRDSQYYVYAGEQGLGLHDMNPARVHPGVAAMGRALGLARVAQAVRAAGCGRRPRLSF